MKNKKQETAQKQEKREFLFELSNMPEYNRIDQVVFLKEQAYEQFEKMTDIEWEEYLIPFVDSYFDGHLPENMDFAEFKELYKKCFENILEEKVKKAREWECENWNAQQP